jgi:putative endonuclease
MASSSRSSRADGAPTSAGARAEELAARFLARHGLDVVARNFRTRYGEIDLIARDGATLVFVEVRLRTSRRFGGAVASITAAKRERLRLAASLYLAQLGREPPCRFDALLLDDVANDRIQWQRDVFSDA